MTESIASLKSAAGELARVLQADPRWLEWTNARQALEQDEELRGWMVRYSQLASKARSGSPSPEALSGTDILEMGTLQGKIEAHASFVRQNEATVAMMGMLHEANTLMSETLGIDFAANAAPHSSCCG